jgi:hypothetical protein
MTAPAKCRHQLYLDKDVGEKLQALAAKPGASKSAVLADAVQAWLTRRGTQELDDRFALRLERISTQLARIERDQQVMMESQALFIRYQLTINAPLPEPDQAARAVGRHRFQSLGRPEHRGRQPDARPRRGNERAGKGQAMSGLSHTEAEDRRRTMPRTAMGKDIAPFYHPWRPFEGRYAYDGRAPSLFGEASAIAGSSGFASIDDDRRLAVAGAAHPPRQHLWLFAVGEQPRDRARWRVPHLCPVDEIREEFLRGRRAPKTWGRHQRIPNLSEVARATDPEYRRRDGGNHGR